MAGWDVPEVIELVGGWALPLWKIWDSRDDEIPNWMEKYVPNHQPVKVLICSNVQTKAN